METTPKISTHQCVGASSCQELPKSISVQGQEQVDSDTNRQHNSSQLHQQTGRDQVSSVMSSSLGVDELVHSAQDSVTRSSHSRSSQHSGRHSLSKVDATYRVGVTRSGDPKVISDMGSSRDKSICHLSEQEDK